MLSFLHRQRAGFVGIDINTHEIRLIYAKKNQIMSAVWCSLTEEKEAETVITQLVSQTKTKGVATAMAIPQRHVIEKQIQFPKEFSAQEIYQEIKTHYLPDPSCDFYFDFFVLKESDPAYQAVQLVIIEKEKVLYSKKMIERAGLKVVCVDVDDYAEKRALQRVPKEIDIPRYLVSYGLIMRGFNATH